MPTPQRPGASRRPAGPPSQAGNKKANGPSAQELMNLPEVVESGSNFEVNPDNTYDGGFGSGEGSKAVIGSARFGRFTYTKKDGSIAKNEAGDEIRPDIRLFIGFEQEGREKPIEEKFSYADLSKFGISSDGNFIRPRPEYLKPREDGYVPVPKVYKFTAGNLFIESLIAAGLSREKFNKEGAASLVGLQVVVRKQKVSGQGANARPVLLVDYIEGSSPVGGSSSGSAPKSTPAKSASSKPAAAPAAEKAQAATADAGSTDVNTLAEQALMSLLAKADNSSLQISTIPTTLIQSAEWSKHAQRGAILKVLRTPEFINRADAPWTVDGDTVSL